MVLRHAFEVARREWNPPIRENPFKRVRLAERPDIAPPERDAKAAHSRLVAYQVEGRLRHLLATGGIPCRMAVALAATFDGAGWSETACIRAGEA